MSRLASQEFVAIVRDMLGGENDSTISDNRILRWINQSYLEVCAFAKPELLGGSETITTSPGTSEYTFSSDNVLTIDDCINNTHNQPLYPISDHQYNQFNLGGTQTGAPVYYYVSGADSSGLTKVEFYPTPNATLSIEFHITKKPTALILPPDGTGETYTTVIHELFDDSIIYRAASRGWYSLGDIEMGKAMRQAAAANDAAAARVNNTLSELGECLISPVGAALNG